MNVPVLFLFPPEYYWSSCGHHSRFTLWKLVPCSVSKCLWSYACLLFCGECKKWTTLITKTAVPSGSNYCNCSNVAILSCYRCVHFCYILACFLQSPWECPAQWQFLWNWFSLNRLSYISPEYLAGSLGASFCVFSPPPNGLIFSSIGPPLP